MIIYTYMYNIFMYDISYIVFIIFVHNTPKVIFPEDAFIFFLLSPVFKVFSAFKSVNFFVRKFWILERNKH